MKPITGAGWLPCDPPASEQKARKGSGEVLSCSLCGSTTNHKLSPDNDSRYYFHCLNCQLIFVHPDFHLPRDKEKSRYMLHDNAINNEGYVSFLKKAIDPMIGFIRPGMDGLDYGCGPAPVLSQILAQKNIRCHNYDPVFGIEHPMQSYDFIFATECFEHFYFPAEEIRKIVNLLRPEGYLAVMTNLWDSTERFNTWYYKRDPTHVSFFHRDSLAYIMQKHELTQAHCDNDRVIIFKKMDEGLKKYKRD